MEPRELIAAARYDAVYEPFDGNWSWEAATENDRLTSLAIADAILDPERDRLSPSTCHEFFRSMVPEDHPQNHPLSELADWLHETEVRGLRAAIAAAVDMHSDDNRLVTMQSTLCIDATLDRIFQSIREEMAHGSKPTPINLFGCLAEHMTERLINAVNIMPGEDPAGPMPVARSLVRRAVDNTFKRHRKNNAPTLPDGMVPFPAPAALQ